jgi:16S rRNA (cytosine1402-N4)-methyltransferase
MPQPTVHEPVLLHETIAALSPQAGDVVLDLTLGGGGHGEALLKAADIRYIGIDADPEALARAGWRLAPFGERVTLAASNFRAVGSVLERLNVPRVHKALFDLGLSSDELELSQRGFSFKENEPLLMTFDPNQNLTARDLLEHLSVQELTDIFRNYGEEAHAYKIAQAIVAARASQPLETTHELVSVIKQAVPTAYAKGRIHPATKTFQALRIAVNDEFDALKEGLAVVWDHLAPGGRLAVISFHSLEDRIVKVFMKEKADAGAGKLLTKKPQAPTAQEVAENPRARSAKLRSIEKIV